MMFSDRRRTDGIDCTRLEIHHHAESEDVVIAVHIRTTRETRIVRNLSRDVVELHSCVGIEQPVETQSQGFAFTTKDIGIAEIRPRESGRHLKGTPATLGFTIAVTYHEEVLEWLSHGPRFRFADSTACARPSGSKQPERIRRQSPRRD